MEIGNLKFDHTAFLAPMAGIADRAFRELCVQHGAAYTVTEMVSSKGLTMGDKKSAQLLTIGSERPCGAQIFGDLFQLLDRGSDGYSEYSINADKDLRDYIRRELNKHKGIDQNTDPEGIEDGKLRLPPNLHILATMNTSDQSLFPMDSAFKRRWDWEYVPIQYEGATSDSFTITLSEKQFRWIDFLKAVNDRIRRTTESEDKQLGNYFIKSDIDEKEFKSKVMFYLWSEVCKDEYLTEQNFMRSMTKNSIEKLNSEKPTDEFFRAHISEYEVEEFSFNDLFSERGTDLLLGFMYSMNVLPIQSNNDSQEP